MKPETMSVSFTESQIDNLIEFIEFNFIDVVRNQEDIDNINYIIDMMEALKKLRCAKKEFENIPIIDQNSCDCATQANDKVEVVGDFINERCENVAL